MRVALLDLRAQYKALQPEIDAAVHRVLASGQYIMGEEITAFEAEMCKHDGLAHAIAVSSGTDALLAALWAIGIGPGDEVVTTTLSFFATAGTVARLGAKPVFADVDPHTLNLDPKSALDRVGPRTKAILPVHLFGRPAELEPLRAAGLPIIEDAAQAVGMPGLGRDNNLVTFSFFPSKNLGAAGDAGMVLTNHTELADKIRLYRTHGARPKYIHHVVGANLRMDPLQAAILRAKLPHLAEWQTKRRANVARYRELLANTPLALPDDAPGHVWHHFVVRAPKRDALAAYLREREIETEVYYPRPLHQQPCFADIASGSLPEAERAVTEVLALPVHPDLSDAQLEFVASTVRAFYA